MVQPFSTVPHVVVIPNHKKSLLLLRNCNFAIAMDSYVNNFGDKGLPKGLRPIG